MRLQSRKQPPESNQRFNSLYVEIERSLLSSF
jgi:hypothetical protein